MSSGAGDVRDRDPGPRAPPTSPTASRRVPRPARSGAREALRPAAASIRLCGSATGMAGPHFAGVRGPTQKVTFVQDRRRSFSWCRHQARSPTCLGVLYNVTCAWVAKTRRNGPAFPCGPQSDRAAAGRSARAPLRAGLGRGGRRREARVREAGSRSSSPARSSSPGSRRGPRLSIARMDRQEGRAEGRGREAVLRRWRRRIASLEKSK